MPPPARPEFAIRSSIGDTRSGRRACSAAVAALLAFGWLGVAHAADCEPRNHLSTCIDADNLWPHAGGGAFYSIGSPITTPEDRVSFGLVVSYLSRPIGMRVASPDPKGTVIYAIDNAVDVNFLWALGLTDRLELTLAAPITIYQDGAGIADVVGSDQELPRSTIRDARFGLTFAVIPRPRFGPTEGLALTTRLEWGVPTGDRDAFAGAPTMVAIPSIALDYVRGRVEIAGEVGARIRGETQLAGARVGSQLSVAAGVLVDVIAPRMLSVGLEAFALYTFADQDAPIRDPDALHGPPLAPAEWILSVSNASMLGGDLRFSLGGGSAIPLATEPALTAPRFRFDFGVRYAPSGHDEDGDGVLDRDDRCPTQPEDRDGFEDADGCPELDNDKDGIPDASDRCRDEAETVDGFQDEDGCPDRDDDGDGVPDSDDRCRNAAEDRDGFEDADGCPDPDNDKDGIPDASDKCPSGAEDRDGFRDDDGCPDPDNDLDGIADVNDLCPDAAEDRDGFQDADGCPDPDNDEDGIADAADKCPNQAETIDGNADGDGCPEAGARSLVRWEGDRILSERAAGFAQGSAAISPELGTALAMVAQLARGRAPLDVVIVEAFGDRTGDASREASALAARRANAVRGALVADGLPSDRITAASGDLAAKRPAGSPALEITVRRAAPLRPKPQEKR